MHRNRVEKLAQLQKNPARIRNVCIMAHVDHGKTTLADNLVASNGIISQKLAGKLRYLDSREDEQQRGITMKSSAIALDHSKENENFLINLIDSPGHVDFSNEVSTAVRLCDGAIILVDIMEGVCPQTKVSLRQAWMEGIQPVLVINKIDRLILDKKMMPLDAYVYLQQTLEQVNAVMGELFASDIFNKSSAENLDTSDKIDLDSTNTKQIYNWSSGLEETDDAHVYFSPEQGNVVFASALDGWGFRVQDFVLLYAKKLNVNVEVLKNTLWGDYYVNSKTQRIMKGAQAKAKKPLFVQFILENIWMVYQAVVISRDPSMKEKIINSLNLKLHPRDLKHSDARITLQAIFNRWLPLSSAVLDMVIEKVPSPLDISSQRVERLMSSAMRDFKCLSAETRKLKEDFLACKASDDAPVIVFVSKMFSVEKKLLPQNKEKRLSPEQIALRRQELRMKLDGKKKEISAEENERSDIKNKPTEDNVSAESEKEDEINPESEYAFIAFARIFSGVLRKGRKLYVLGPKHDPTEILDKIQKGLLLDETLTLKDLKPHQHITCCEIEDLYVLLGREMELLEEVPAGNILGIGNVEEHVLKTATLSTTLACPPFVELLAPVVPIVRVALEPVHPANMPALVSGLKLLNQADASVQVLVQETGEHVIITAGEVHLQRCVDDLKQMFAKIDINVSKPIVAFRETVILPPKFDMVNEIIEDKNQVIKTMKSVTDDNASRLIVITTANKMSTIQIKAVPLPLEITQLLENNCSILKMINKKFSSSHTAEENLSEEAEQSIEDFRNKFFALCKAAGKRWRDVGDHIWAFGPRRCGPNLLVNQIPNYFRPSLLSPKNVTSLSDTLLSQFDGSFVSGFQLATLAGPLCEEPMMGVCFFVEKWDLKIPHDTTFKNDNINSLKPKEEKLHSEIDIDPGINGETISACGHSQVILATNQKLIKDIDEGFESTAPFGPFSGQIMSAVKEGCRKAFQAQPQRLMAAMYSCNIQVTGEVLGKMYAVLGRRHGRVLSSDLQEGSQTFNVVATLPVIESFDFAIEIRKQTSGMAMPQLIFSHWEVVDTDPFWVPSTEEEYAHYGEKADSENRALRYMNAVRRRKGLSVEEKIVEHAEKQRTLTRNK